MPGLSHYNVKTSELPWLASKKQKGYNVWKLIWSWGWMGRTTRWMESSVVCRVFEFFFFFKRNFLPQARSLCVRETVSFLCSKAVRDDWDLRAVSDVDEVKGGSTVNHQSLRQRWAEETREPHSETWKAILSRGTEGQGEGQMRERKKRHRSNGHPKFTTLVFSWNQRNFLSPSWECSEERSWLEAKTILILLCLINIWNPPLSFCKAAP